VLEEVVVSAQKRSQNIQDVGISISAFTGEQLVRLGVTESVDLAHFTPGVFTSGAIAGQNTQFTIRGVTQNDFNDIVEAPNAVYLDDGYIAIAQAQTFALFDIDRVEILKGPQGTLFGRNATGGAVQYLSRKPSFEKVEGYAEVTGGYFDTDAHAASRRVEAALSAPFTDWAAGRIAVLYNNNDAYIKNLYPYAAPTVLGGVAGSPSAPGAGANLGDDDTYAVRGTLDLKPREDVLVRFSGNYAETRMSSAPYFSKSTIGVVDPATNALINVINTPPNETRLTLKGGADGGANAFDGSSFLPGAGLGLPGRPVPGGDFFGYVPLSGWDTSSDYTFHHQNATRTHGVNGRLEWKLSDHTSLTVVSDYKEYWKLVFLDVDAGPVNQLANYAGVNASSFTQEVRLNGQTDHTRWVTGLYYLNIDNHSDNGLKAPTNSIVGTFIEPVDIGVVSRLRTNSYSLFGQGEYDFTDKLTGILGVRGIEEKKDFRTLIGVFQSLGSFTVDRGAPIAPDPLGAGSPYNYAGSNSETLWAGKAQLDWHVQDGLLVYGGINRGVKAGSYNAPLLGAYLGSGLNASLPYRPETLVSYEAGFKSTLQDGRTRLNASVFHYDYKDYQTFLFVGVGGVVINRDATNNGVELELQTRPAKGWDFLVSASYFDATVKNVPLSFGSPLPPRDVKPTYAPQAQAVAMLRYEWPAFAGLMHVLGSANYTDSFYYNLRNFSADQFPAVTLVNLGAGWVSRSDQWQVSFDVRNVTNKQAGQQGYDLATLCGCNEVSYQPPRWYGASVRLAF
jgi:iron complex outermembrane receptor protein